MRKFTLHDHKYICFVGTLFIHSNTLTIYKVHINKIKEKRVNETEQKSTLIINQLQMYKESTKIIYNEIFHILTNCLEIV